MQLLFLKKKAIKNPLLATGSLLARVSLDYVDEVYPTDCVSICIYEYLYNMKFLHTPKSTPKIKFNSHLRRIFKFSEDTFFWSNIIVRRNN